MHIDNKIYAEVVEFGDPNFDKNSKSKPKLHFR